MSLRNKIATASVAGMLSIATPLVMVQEGLSVVPYSDPTGTVTWCYGETEGPVPTNALTEQECSFMLKAKLYTIGLAVWYLVKTPMTNERWASLTSFTYNVGIGAFRTSTLLKRINAADGKACDELRRWTKSKGVYLKGLANRREKERSLCLQ